MKIALCLSGQPRGLPMSLQLLKDGILNHNPDIDIFIHTWFDNSYVNIPFDSAQPGHTGVKGSWHPQTEEMLNSLNPKKILMEPPQEFKHLSHLANRESAIQTKLASMFCSAFKSNKLKCEFEMENDFKYDIVIKSRIDLHYAFPVIVKNLIDQNINSNLYVPSMHQWMRMGDSYPIKSGGNYSSMSDTWIMGSSDNIDKACSVYEKFEEIHEKIFPHVYGEAYLGYVVRGGIYNIPISMVNINYNIFRGS